jgi:hypothetical protein
MELLEEDGARLRKSIAAELEEALSAYGTVALLWSCVTSSVAIARPVACCPPRVIKSWDTAVT